MKIRDTTSGPRAEKECLSVRECNGKNCQVSIASSRDNHESLSGWTPPSLSFVLSSIKNLDKHQLVGMSRNRESHWDESKEILYFSVGKPNSLHRPKISSPYSNGLLDVRLRTRLHNAIRYRTTRVRPPGAVYVTPAARLIAPYKRYVELWLCECSCTQSHFNSSERMPRHFRAGSRLLHRSPPRR